ncbi:MAG: hypothetical protein Q9170_003542 [Blastenia crenularia]
MSASGLFCDPPYGPAVPTEQKFKADALDEEPEDTDKQVDKITTKMKSRGAEVKSLKSQLAQVKAELKANTATLKQRMNEETVKLEEAVTKIKELESQLTFFRNRDQAIHQTLENTVNAFDAHREAITTMLKGPTGPKSAVPEPFKGRQPPSSLFSIPSSQRSDYPHRGLEKGLATTQGELEFAPRESLPVTATALTDEPTTLEALPLGPMLRAAELARWQFPIQFRQGISMATPSSPKEQCIKQTLEQQPKLSTAPGTQGTVRPPDLPAVSGLSGLFGTGSPGVSGPSNAPERAQSRLFQF